jgi:hypothetical protein
MRQLLKLQPAPQPARKVVASGTPKSKQAAAGKEAIAFDPMTIDD